MRKIMLAALDDAVRAHVVKLFGVLMTDSDNDMAVQHFENGIGKALVAYDRVHAAICDKCGE